MTIDLKGFLGRWPLHWTALISVVVIQAFLTFVPMDPQTTPAWLVQVWSFLKRINGVQIAAVLGYWIQWMGLKGVRDRASLPQAHWSLIVTHEVGRVWLWGAAIVGYCVYQ